MYGVYTYIYHKNQPNVGKYTIHGSYGNRNSIHIIDIHRRSLAPSQAPQGIRNPIFIRKGPHPTIHTSCFVKFFSNHVGKRLLSSCKGFNLWAYIFCWKQKPSIVSHVFFVVSPPHDSYSIKLYLKRYDVVTSIVETIHLHGVSSVEGEQNCLPKSHHVWVSIMRKYY